MAGGQGRSIGQVLALLQEDFPDVSLSKIRFLESEGLVSPARSASGYRRFSDDDVRRLRTVLHAQRDEFLPLRVIRERLDATDDGRGVAAPAAGSPAAASTSAGPAAPAAAPASASSPATAAGRPAEAAGPPTAPAPPARGPLASEQPSDARLTRSEIARLAGLDLDGLAELEAAGLVRTVEGSRLFDGHALAVARAAAGLGRFGLEPRHLRVIRSAAEREAGLVEQVVAPLRGQRAPGARARAEDTAHEVRELCLALHAALVRAGAPPR